MSRSRVASLACMPPNLARDLYWIWLLHRKIVMPLVGGCAPKGLTPQFDLDLTLIRAVSICNLTSDFHEPANRLRSRGA